MNLISFLLDSIIECFVHIFMSSRLESSGENKENQKEAKMSQTPQENAPKEFELYTDERGEFRWRLRARNGRVIATSGEGYINKEDARHAITLVKNASSLTDIEDLT